MDQRPTTEDPSRPAASTPSTPEPPEWCGIKSGVRLPEKVAAPRRKLYQKAKQEPTFRFYALYDRIYRHDVLAAAWGIVLAKDKAPGTRGWHSERCTNSSCVDSAITCGDEVNGPTVHRQASRSMLTSTTSV